jgi:hypothetical protein
MVRALVEKALLSASCSVWKVSIRVKPSPLLSLVALADPSSYEIE